MIELYNRCTMSLLFPSQKVEIKELHNYIDFEGIG